jgi:hypothetical protein
MDSPFYAVSGSGAVQSAGSGHYATASCPGLTFRRTILLFRFTRPGALMNAFRCEKCLSEGGETSESLRNGGLEID